MAIVRKRCITAQKKNMRIAVATAILLILAVIIGVFYLRYAKGYATFKIPVHEANAIEGVPDEDAASGFTNLPVTDGYTLGICPEPRCQNGQLYLYACNGETNTIWYLVRVYDEEKLIGESGLLYPGEYLESVALTEEVAPGQELTVKTLAYTPKEYHSEGTVTLVCKVAEEQEE